MSNLTQNRLNVTLTPANMTAIKVAIDTVATQLPAGSLTDEERGSFRAIDVNNKVFVEDVITEMAISGAGIIPPFLSAAIIQTDFTLFGQLDSIESNLLGVLRRVTDLKRICGSEGYDNGLAVYKIYEAAAMAGIPGAKESYEKLRQRFEGQGGKPQDPQP
ncbi:MAG: hypothetical protein H7239_06040 [Flavobacterium sp.]|nr:hypothetical protein [Flavobacterium sp.]